MSVDLSNIALARQAKHIAYLRDGAGTLTAWGPFDSALEAAAFAEVISAAIDPCSVTKLCSPTAELVGAYRDARDRGNQP